MVTFQLLKGSINNNIAIGTRGVIQLTDLVAVFSRQ